MEFKISFLSRIFAVLLPLDVLLPEYVCLLCHNLIRRMSRGGGQMQTKTKYISIYKKRRRAAKRTHLHLIMSLRMTEAHVNFHTVLFHAGQVNGNHRRKTNNFNAKVEIPSLVPAYPKCKSVHDNSSTATDIRKGNVSEP